eukprot:COSAG05_NODE_10959_length_537_cov_0.883562_1_plen_64_part_10
MKFNDYVVASAMVYCTRTSDGDMPVKSSARPMPPAANDPRAIGLKNSGLSALDTDIIFPSSGRA